ncbi:hypothetical protein Cs7R123_72960 [Catellatospora sp. TT07R-123]|uniref:hypothetical protein n=1 Tax=Catellatospora sp. TT07R-123 TaxID=2733863 RepID=UPI001B0DA06F|nr:hypothetical protein [Catellatospora sp. TT07R-123]GHJ49954.1 hypothetical protein Cs7R123_72960 [Catellatospora sp. TT07R-123]
MRTGRLMAMVASTVMLAACANGPTTVEPTAAPTAPASPRPALDCAEDQLTAVWDLPVSSTTTLESYAVHKRSAAGVDETAASYPWPTTVPSVEPEELTPLLGWLVSSLNEAGGPYGATAPRHAEDAMEMLMATTFKTAGTYAAYSGIDKIVATFQLSCKGSAHQVSGVLRTWTGSTIGILDCGRKPPVERFGALAHRHCGVPSKP